LPVSYDQAGVDIKKGDRFVQHLKRDVRSTFNKSVLGGIGGFGAFYQPAFRSYRTPVLVSSVDGVGTKLLVAQMMKRHHTVGQDLVNHCVNDIVACGAKPLYFMDYFACGKLDLDVAKEVMDGFVTACKENHCALIGGETAEMPGLYGEHEYDLAGTIVGIVERKKIIDGTNIRRGDVLIGLRSTGLHTNGYSLARSVLLPAFRLDQYVDVLGATIGDALLAVHRSYLHVVSALLRKFEIRGLAHVTGGGIVGNTMRVVPKGLHLNIDWQAWERPPIFNLIQEVGSVSDDEMRRAFNLGIGMIAIVPVKTVTKAMTFLTKRGERPVVVGEVARS
jgi:phosphoribosylformylglycinamidine cyclo-ligase